MDSDKLEKFRDLLNQLATEWRAGLSQRDATEPVQLDTSIGRLSRMDAMQSQQMALALKERQRQQLVRVERALRSIEDGTFGVCRVCRGPIAEERLEMQPEATVCVTCAAKAERR
jgi:DnaK suppressor protein